MALWRLKTGISLSLAVACLAGTTGAFAGDKVTTRKVAPKSATTTRAKTGNKPETSRQTSEIVPANYSPVAEIQDSTIDECEAMKAKAQTRAARLYNESLIARCHRLKYEEHRLEHENCKDWFNYIRGYGPVIWVRNGPELRWHPPSIPFAKRVGGTTVRPWEGVTDIPKQPDISPRRVNEIHHGDLQPECLK